MGMPDMTKTILDNHMENPMSKLRSPSGNQIIDIPSFHRPIDWSVDQFCKSYDMAEKDFYSLVKSGQIRLMKRGQTELVSEAERRRYQAAVQAGEA
jgi:hypothetical protein